MSTATGIIGYTRSETEDEMHVKINLNYPKRSFSKDNIMHLLNSIIEELDLPDSQPSQ